MSDDSNLLVSLRPSRNLCAPCGFPKNFSNHWKTVGKFFQSLEEPPRIFQPLEKSFPTIGKNGANFPTIGNFFSNHWKTSVPPTSYQIGQNPAGAPPFRRPFVFPWAKTRKDAASLNAFQLRPSRFPPAPPTGHWCRGAPTATGPNGFPCRRGSGPGCRPG